MRTVADEAFVRWAVRRHVWLHRLSERSRSRRVRSLALRVYVGLIKLDRAAWVTFNGH